MALMNIEQMQHRRGRILAMLAQSPRGSAAVALLRGSLSRWGYRADPDTIRDDIQWLDHHRLIERSAIGEAELLVITEHGRAIVSGDLDYPGIKLFEA